METPVVYDQGTSSTYEQPVVWCTDGKELMDPKVAEKIKSHKVSGKSQDRIYKNVLNWSSKHGGNNQDEIILFSKCVEVQLFLVFLFGKLLLYFGQVTNLSHPQLASHKLTSQGKLLNHISLGKSLFVPH